MTPVDENKVTEGDLVAVYGTLKRGFHNHRVLGDSVFLGAERTQDIFRMVSLGGYPALLEGDSNVAIEVFRVASDAVGVGLDRLEGYPSFYDRRLIPTSHGDAWVYFMHNTSHFGPERTVASGEW